MIDAHVREALLSAALACEEWRCRDMIQPRNKRRIMVGLMLVVLAFLVPALLMLTGWLTGAESALDSCPRVASSNSPWFCTLIGRVLLAIVFVSVLTPIGIRIGRILQNYLDSGVSTSPPQVLGSDRSSQESGRDGSRRTGLYRGVAWGTVIRDAASVHLATISDKRCYFWNQRILDSISRRESSGITVAYQELPGIPSVRFAVAYKDPVDSRIRGVADRIFFISIIMLICSALILKFLAVHLYEIFLPLIELLFFGDCIALIAIWLGRLSLCDAQ